MINKSISQNKLLILVAILAVGLIVGAGVLVSIDERTIFLGLSLLAFVAVLTIFHFKKWIDWVVFVISILVYGIVQYSFHDYPVLFWTHIGIYIFAALFTFILSRAIHHEIGYLIDQYSSSNVLIDELTLHDALGLIKWRVFLQKLNEEFIRGRRTKKPVSVLMVHLLNYNDLVTKGNHERAEELMVETAKISNGILRALDIVSRYDQDTLGVILPETSEEETRIAASRLINGIAQQVNAAVCVGIAIFPNDAAAVDKMISRALAALEFAISSGKEQVSYSQLNADEENNEE
jgi:diguanylate cyclase (GGDEF)-like protein